MTATGAGSDLTTLDLTMVRATFPGWRIFSSAGCWWAIRGGLEFFDGPKSLLRCTLSASTLVRLAEKLSLQEYLDGLTAEELADVYARASLPTLPEMRLLS